MQGPIFVAWWRLEDNYKAVATIYIYPVVSAMATAVYTRIRDGSTVVTKLVDRGSLHFLCFLFVC